MVKTTYYFTIILLTISFLACKNEQKQEQPDTAPAPAHAVGNSAAAQLEESNISFIAKEKIVMKDATQIVFPKEGNTDSIVFFFATPGQSFEGKTSLSEQGLLQSQMLTMKMAKAGLAIAYVDGNAAMQTALGAARANYAEYFHFKKEATDETLKVLVNTYMGKKVMVCAEAPVVSSMMAQLTGKAAPTIPTAPNNKLYLAIAKGIGDGEVRELSY
jgi:hypothetical protein